MLSAKSFIVFAACAAFLAACTAASKRAAGAGPPDWLDHPQISKAELCATGVSGPTYYPQDAVARSRAAALNELGRAVQVRVTSELSMRQRESGAGSSVSVEELSTFMSQAVLKLAQMRGQWINPGGHPSRGEAGTTYSLICMPLNVSTADLENTARGITPTPVSNAALPQLIKESEAVFKEWTQ
jgi:hypothetical protein